MTCPAASASLWHTWPEGELGWECIVVCGWCVCRQRQGQMDGRQGGSRDSRSHTVAVGTPGHIL